MKESFIFEGKKYISSRRASEISGYASDYIGQLCRGSKLDCRMIGRSWFVTEESLHLHKATISREEASRSRIENLRGKASNKTDSLPVQKVQPVAPVVSETAVQEKNLLPANLIVAEPLQVKPSFVYSKDERPLLPVLNKKSEPVNAVAINKTIDAVLSERKVEIKKTPKTFSTVISSLKPADKELILPEKKENKKSTLTVSPYAKLVRGIILKRVIAPTVAVAILFAVGTGTYITAEKVSTSIPAEVYDSASMITANVSDAFGLAYKTLKDGYKSVVAFFTSPAKLALDRSSIKEFGDVTVSEVTPNGIVLTSSVGSEVGDDVLKQQIRGSFSDEVEVRPDQSGTAGVITPVFKDTKGKDFVYVMVPVKEKEAKTDVTQNI